LHPHFCGALRGLPSPHRGRQTTVEGPIARHAGGEDGRATLIDWADAAWADPAADFGSIPARDVPHVLEGYEDVASLGPGAEGRILRALIGQSVRKLVTSAWGKPLEELVAWASEELPARFRDWV